MSVIASTPQQICNSPLNTSKSKMQFSFPKSNKFGLEIKSVCPQAYYELPSVKNTRSPSFGYGQKSDFTQTQINNPAPSAYKIADPFQDNKRKGYSFGLSREAMVTTGGQFVGEKKSPGPGAYDIREINKVKIAFTFKNRTAASDTLTTQRCVPGPGAYPSYTTITPKGKYCASKNKNTQATIIAPPRSARFPSLRDGIYPGPGSYNLNLVLSESFVSKFKTSMARTFGHNARNTMQSPSIVVPGPGSYKIPSDFGHYESAHPQTTRESMAVKNIDTEKKIGKLNPRSKSNAIIEQKEVL